MSGGSPEEGGERRRRRRHRRVDAPPTNPTADAADDVPGRTGQTRASAPGAQRATVDDAREAWIRAQRPPHWD